MKTQKEKIVKLKISGMSCSSCVNHIEKDVSKIQGVQKVSVNLIKEVAQIVYSDPTSPEEITKVIEKAGYKVNTENVPHSSTSLKIKKDNRQKEQKIFEFKDLLISIIFTVPLFIIAMMPMFRLNIDQILGPLVYATIEFLLLVPVIIIGRKFYINGYRNLIKRNPTMDSLIAIGTSAAIIYSIYGMYEIMNGNLIGLHYLYFETAGVILTLITLGKTMENISKNHTSDAIKKLEKLQPSTAIKIINDKEIKIDIKEIKVGNILLVKPGDSFPLDGIIVKGNCEVNESMMTGESENIQKKIGDEVYGATYIISGGQLGSKKGEGEVQIKVTKIGADTMLSQIVELVDNAQMSKPQIARIADLVAKYFVPFVILVAIISSILWYNFLPFFLENNTIGHNIMQDFNDIQSYQFEFAIKIFIAVLVIACPCAIGLATPTAIMVGTGLGATKGLLFKGGVPLETLSKVQTIFFDKTGTLTQGKVENGKVIGDEIKPSAKQTLLELKNMGIETIMLSGDYQEKAEKIGKKLGISRVISGIKPGGKLQYIEIEQSKGKIVAMVGDGINDAPALTKADIGLAIGKGTDIAMSSADIVLINDSLLSIIGAIKLSKKTILNIKENLGWSLIYNIIGIPFACGIIYIFGGPLLNPMIAALAMSLSSISVVLNALRLKFVKI